VQVTTRLNVVLIAALWGGQAYGDELALIHQVMAQVQPQSIKQNREYCGYLGRNAQGVLISTAPSKGRRHSCTPDWPDGVDVIASWHTHGAFDATAWSEVPSVSDIEADQSEGIDGYLGTPGGRLWHIDTQTMQVRLICGPGCIAHDGRFKFGAEGWIASRYSYDQLLAREGQ